MTEIKPYKKASIAVKQGTYERSAELRKAKADSARRQWGSALARRIVRRVLAELHIELNPSYGSSQRLYRAVQEELYKASTTQAKEGGKP